MSRRAIYFALILFVCAISAVVGISANYTASATLPAPQSVTLSGMTEGIDVRWNIPPGSNGVANYQIAYQAMERRGIAGSWAYMWTQGRVSTHLIRHLAGGYEYRVYVRSCSETQCNSAWAYGGTVWTKKPTAPTVYVSPVPTPTPTPTATPRPTPTVTPTRIPTATPIPTLTPTATPIPECILREGTIRGELYNGYHIAYLGGGYRSHQIYPARVKFTNPSESWEYGFRVRWSGSKRAEFVIDEAGKWSLKFGEHIANKVVASGNADVRAQEGATNDVQFVLVTPAAGYPGRFEFTVNGKTHKLETLPADFDSVNRHVNHWVDAISDVNPTEYKLIGTGRQCE